MFLTGKEAEEETQRARAAGTIPGRGRKNGRRRAEDKLRVADLWCPINLCLGNARASLISRVAQQER